LEKSDRLEESQDWVEEWKKRDPYFLDMDGFLKFVKQKETEIRVKVEVWVDKGYNGGYDIYLSVPFDVVPDEYKNTDVLEKAEEIERRMDKIREFFSPNMDRCAPNKLGLRPGATKVFRKEDGKWYYYGDYSHVPQEDIDNNAKILWKIWKTVGSHLPGVWGVSKDYQCDSRSVYLIYKTKASKEPDFPALGRYEMSLERTMQEAERLNEPIKPLETEEPEGPIWEELHLLAQSLLLEEIPNLDDPFEDDYIWVTQDDLPICSIHKPSIPEVMNYLAEGKETWEPENDVELMRQGGLGIIHPFLREQRTFVWAEEDVEWDAEPADMRDLYHRQFSREELGTKKVDELKNICKAKNLQVKRGKHEMINAILEANYSVIEEATTVVA